MGSALYSLAWAAYDLYVVPFCAQDEIYDSGTEFHFFCCFAAKMLFSFVHQYFLAGDMRHLLHSIRR